MSRKLLSETSGGAFTWGRVINYYEYDFDGEVMRVTKYHPWKREGCNIRTGQPNMDEVAYHCEETRESASSIYTLLISWLAYKQLGLNQYALTSGICRALKIDVES